LDILGSSFLEIKIIATHKIMTIIIAFTAELKSSLLSADFDKLHAAFGSSCHELLELSADVDSEAIDSLLWGLFGSARQIEAPVMLDIIIKNMMNFILYLAIKKPPEIISRYGSLTANIVPKR
jgi:hypothetical protein